MFANARNGLMLSDVSIEMKTYQKKVCLIGDFAVGKTSLIRRFVDGIFDDKYLTTVGVVVSRKLLIPGGFFHQIVGMGLRWPWFLSTWLFGRRRRRVARL